MTTFLHVKYLTAKLTKIFKSILSSKLMFFHKFFRMFKLYLFVFVVRLLSSFNNWYLTESAANNVVPSDNHVLLSGRDFTGMHKVYMY